MLSGPSGGEEEEEGRSGRGSFDERLKEKAHVNCMLKHSP